jgi:hypothetical protein
VTTGFTTGIATVIATLQIKDMAGLQVGPMPEHFTDKVAMLWAARGTVSLQELGVAVATLGLLLGIPAADAAHPCAALGDRRGSPRSARCSTTSCRRSPSPPSARASRPSWMG